MIKVRIFSASLFSDSCSQLIDGQIISKCGANRYASDRYFGKFKTEDHLIGILFCSFAECVPLRKVTIAMLGLLGKTRHLQLGHTSGRSTPSDAKKCRDAKGSGSIHSEFLRR